MHTASQVLLISNSPYTDDKAVLQDWITRVQQSGTQINVISFCGVVQVLKVITALTKGRFLSPLSELDYEN